MAFTKDLPHPALEPLEAHPHFAPAAMGAHHLVPEVDGQAVKFASVPIAISRDVEAAEFPGKPLPPHAGGQGGVEPGKGLV